ncbi:glycoside hydrolase family 43 protein [Natronospora cellulosivora (SeqCode)]
MTLVKDSTEYRNPLIEQRADPFIYKHSDGFYYFTASVPEYDRIILRKSKTINGLAEAEEKVIWTKHSKGEMGAHIWAPEIHYIDGKWYIYFAAGGAEDVWAIRQYVLECSDADPLNGNWVEKGKIKMNFEEFTLDATSFEHNGEQYLVWAQKYENQSNLYIAKMSNPWTIEGEQVLISSPEYDWERIGHFVNEGPAVIKRNGKIFLAYSASATDHNYCMGLLTADEDSDLLHPDSWTKNPEPVYTTNPEIGEYGPGHNSFTVAEDGETDLLVYHARPYKELQGSPLSDPNRHARVKVLDWNPDGTPKFA